MNKTVLVLDMPNSCDKCPLCFDSYGQCDLCAATGHLDKCGDMIYEEVIKIDNKPNWCPLKDLPHKRYHSAYGMPIEMSEDKIWNKCIDKIIGEDEENK